MSKRGGRTDGNKTVCPVCGGATKTAKTYQVSRQYREATLVCQNAECGAIFVVGISPVRILEAGKQPLAQQES